MTPVNDGQVVRPASEAIQTDKRDWMSRVLVTCYLVWMTESGIYHYRPVPLSSGDCVMGAQCNPQRMLHCIHVFAGQNHIALVLRRD